MVNLNDFRPTGATIFLWTIILATSHLVEAAPIAWNTPDINSVDLSYLASTIATIAVGGALAKWHAWQPGSTTLPVNNTAKYLTGTSDERAKAFREYAAAKLGSSGNVEIPKSAEKVINPVQIRGQPLHAFLSASARWQDAWDKIEVLKQVLVGAKTRYENFRNRVRENLLDQTRPPDTATDEEILTAFEKYQEELVTLVWRYDFAKSTGASSHRLRTIIETWRKSMQEALGIKNMDFTLDDLKSALAGEVTLLRNARRPSKTPGNIGDIRAKLEGDIISATDYLGRKEPTDAYCTHNLQVDAGGSMKETLAAWDALARKESRSNKGLAASIISDNKEILNALGITENVKLPFVKNEIRKLTDRLEAKAGRPPSKTTMIAAIDQLTTGSSGPSVVSPCTEQQLNVLLSTVGSTDVAGGIRTMGDAIDRMKVLLADMNQRLPQGFNTSVEPTLTRVAKNMTNIGQMVNVIIAEMPVNTSANWNVVNKLLTIRLHLVKQIEAHLGFGVTETGHARQVLAALSDTETDWTGIAKACGLNRRIVPNIVDQQGLERAVHAALTAKSEGVQNTGLPGGANDDLAAAISALAGRQSDRWDCEDKCRIPSTTASARPSLSGRTLPDAHSAQSGTRTRTASETKQHTSLKALCVKRQQDGPSTKTFLMPPPQPPASARPLKPLSSSWKTRVESTMSNASERR